MQAENLGLLVLDKHGERIHASGLARDFCVAEEMRRRLAASTTPCGPLRLASCPGLAAVAFASDESTCVVLMEPARANAWLQSPQATLPPPDVPARGPDMPALEAIVGSSEAIARLRREIRRVAPLDVPVLLAGESGTGKELVANAIHSLSGRARAGMVTVNAAALPATLVESELFGYDPGAFTGAERRGRRGKFEQADGGTLFLDEIGDMPADIQVKLLRVLQDGAFQRVGSERTRHADFRLVCASHRDLPGMLDDGRFRLDLYYRISAVTLEVPPLRERLEDIPVLVEHFLQDFARRNGGRKKTVQDGVIQYLQSLPWPGNVRQLQHAVERAAIYADGDAISSANFGALLRQMPQRRPQDCASLKSAKDQVEGELIRNTLRRLAGNKKRAAAELGISRSYLYKRMDELDL